MKQVTTSDYALVIKKAREILRETAPVEIDGEMQPLCSDDAIDAEKLKGEMWYMNHLDAMGRPTKETDAFMCFGTLDFNELFYLNKSVEGVEDFQKDDFKAKVRSSSQPRLFTAAENTMKDAGYRYIFLQVGCKDQSKLAAYYAYNGLTIVMLAEEKTRGRSKRKRQSVVIKANAEWGFVFWGWKDMLASVKKLKF